MTPARGHRPSVSPLALVSAATEHASLLWQFSRRELAGRYRGSLLGFGWAIVNPLLLLAIYTFVFSVVFALRWDGPIQDRAGFALVIYTGMIVHTFFAECLTRAPTLIVDNRNLVKRVVFPLHMLPWSVLLVATFHYLVGVLLVALAVVVRTGALPPSALALPALWIPQALLALGIAYGFAALGVYLRDLTQLAGFLALTLLFMSPVFYPVSAVPAAWRILLDVNPLATLIEATRAALLYGRWPEPAMLAGLWLLAAVVAWVGFYGFQRTRRGFADVL